MCRDRYRNLLGDVTCCLLSPVLDDEAAESAEINRVTLCKRILYNLHDAVHYCCYLLFLNSG